MECRAIARRQRRATPRCRLLQIIVVRLMVATLLSACGTRDERDGAAVARSVSELPDSVRIRVEIVNTTPQRGLARRAMFFLRDQGFDVVRYSSGSPTRDSSQVIDRSGHLAWAQLVGKALGVSRIVVDVDSARYLDVSVLLGRDWRPPAKPFYP